MTDPRYPIGRFARPDAITPELLRGWIADIERLPSDLERLTGSLKAAQLNTPYREGGWTARQVVHHIADAQMNLYLRIKWGLTETDPTIKPYDENAWAAQADYAGPIQSSLDLLAALTVRWVALMRAMQPADFDRRFIHPESGPTPLGVAVALAAWHGRHHFCQIQALAQREGWLA
jgi:uncharacterized damage-inducible protein DinB